MNNNFTTNTFLAIFEEALDQRPFLLLEIGFNRKVDWMVHIHDSQGVGIADAPKIIMTQELTVEEACKAAAAKLIEKFDLYDDLKHYISTSVDDLRITVENGSIKHDDLDRLSDYLSMHEGFVSKKALVSRALKKAQP